MPDYDYKCGGCGHVAEVSKPIADCARAEVCPKCGAVMDKIYTPVKHYWQDCEWPGGYASGKDGGKA